MLLPGACVSACAAAGRQRLVNGQGQPSLSAAAHLDAAAGIEGLQLGGDGGLAAPLGGFMHVEQGRVACAGGRAGTARRAADGAANRCSEDVEVWRTQISQVQCLVSLFLCGLASETTPAEGVTRVLANLCRAAPSRAGGSGGGGGGGDRTGAAGRRTRETVLIIRTAHISGHQRHGSGRPERALELSSAGLVACSPQPPRSRFVRAHRGPVSAIRRLARAASTARRLPCPASPGTSPCQPPMPPTGTAMRCLKPSSVQQLMGRRSGAAAVAGQRRHAAQVTAAAYYSGKDISPPAKGHHFLHIDDFSREQLREWRRGCTACRGHAATRSRGWARAPRLCLGTRRTPLQAQMLEGCLPDTATKELQLRPTACAVPLCSCHAGHCG